jgi:anti-sigma-K factor RskA
VTVKEYIESGLLEAYVMGMLSDDESAKVQDAAVQYPEIRAELDAIETALNTYANSHSVEPSEEIKAKVLSQISKTSQGEGEIIRIGQLNVEPNTQQDPRNNMVWSIAASVLLLLSLGINIYLYNKSTITENKAHTLTIANKDLDSSVKLLTANMKKMSSDMDRYKNDMAILMDPMYKLVELKGMKVSPEAKAMVCWCPGSRLVYFENEKMPDPPKGMQYQLWAIVDGKPVDAGLITMGAGLHKMKDVTDAQSFAVTLEKEGGSDTPHGDMYVVGNI